jgi:hypothetical protein
MIHIVTLGEGHFAVATVTAGRGSIDQVLAGNYLAALQKVYETNKVVLDISVGIFNRVTHSGLGGQMQDPTRPFRLERLLQPGPVHHIKLEEAKIGMDVKARQSGFLQINIVLIDEIIDTDHLIAPRQ